MPIIFDKKIGETPLGALNRLRNENPNLKDERLSYAGRLDPLAEGLLLVLVGDECNDGQRQSFLGLEKEYEIEVLFGLSTDSFDILGIPKSSNVLNIDVQKILPEFIGSDHGLKYPPFSSKTINGRPLFEMAKSGTITDDELPSIKGSIKNIVILSTKIIDSSALNEHVHKVISLVSGDFRQKEILQKWETLMKEIPKGNTWPIYKLKVQCESGVYMRSLAESLGRRLGCGGLAFSIKRTKIGDYTSHNTA